MESLNINISTKLVLIFAPILFAIPFSCLLYEGVSEDHYPVLSISLCVGSAIVAGIAYFVGHGSLQKFVFGLVAVIGLIAALILKFGL